ncbi:MAG: DUF4062 domain-containing protein [Burkholderiales bacterium]
MARIYVSSTYEDLKTFREAAYKTLRQLKHDAIAMEDYGAADARPVQKCLADVASCDVYVGLIGYRYGYIPGEGNPDGKSITELEYREADKHNKQRLIFIYSGDLNWRLGDNITGAGDRGRLLEVFKSELQKRHVVSEFATADELGQKLAVAVTAAVQELEANGKSGPPGGANEQPELEALRRSARTILKLYGAKSIHDILHDIYLKARVLRADDPEQIDGRTLSDVASYCAPKLTSIQMEITQCERCLDDADREWFEAHRVPFEGAIAALRTAAADEPGPGRANAIGDFNQRLGAWLSDLDNVLKNLADKLDGDQIRLDMGRVKDRYAAELEPVERSLEVLMADVNPVLSKCKALVEEHHGLQDVHDKLPWLFDQLAAKDAQFDANEWRRVKRRLNSARDAWERFGALPSGGADWEEDVRDDARVTWPLVDTCIKDVDGMFAPESAAMDATSQVVRPLTKLQARVEEHFKIVDEALREGYRLFKVRVGEPIMEIS